MLERFSNSDIWLTYILIGVFVAIVALKQINSYRFTNLFKLGWSNQYIKHVLSSPKSDFYFSGLLVVLSSFCVALFFITYYTNYLGNVNEINFELLLKVLILISSYLIFRFLTQKFIGFIFQIDKIITQYLCFKFSLLYYASILSYIPLILLVYSDLSELYINIFIVILTSFYVIRIILFYLKSRSLISNHLFYFILYICSFEILPIFLLIWYMK
ncbi:DUF4271 domain-containing protein [Psychroflexus planctonicus]|uniref:DUF4271 domain-containing protein n=1 Tax=Psychroflexus planctonicus TaxID=1526575 RepID=UPI003571670A